jgi:RNA polymerase sigma-70 factor (ECF subfamily)
MGDVAAFEAYRPALLSLAYRMLGDMARSEDMVQEAWLRWQGRDVDVENPKGYLLKVVTHLCLNELSSARARREESRGDRLPEPLDVDEAEVGDLDQISMAFLVVLQRLTPAERAVLLLHDVFDMEHGEIAQIVKKSDAACRKLLQRARDNVATERRVLRASREEHQRLLEAFMRAAGQGKLDELCSLLADDAQLIIDAGPEGARFGRVKNLPGPLTGASRVAAFVAAVTPQGSANLVTRECRINGQPAVLLLREERAFAAIVLAVADGKIRHIFIHAYPARLGRIRVLG